LHASNRRAVETSNQAFCVSPLHCLDAILDLSYSSFKLKIAKVFQNEALRIIYIAPHIELIIS
jgi:hypothetical protein